MKEVETDIMEGRKSANDAAGNMEGVKSLLESGSVDMAVIQLNWSIKNSQRSIRMIKMALAGLGETK
jgi:hypothetical protein